MRPAIIDLWKLLISRLFAEFVLQFPLPERVRTSESKVHLGALKSASRRSTCAARGALFSAVSIGGLVGAIERVGHANPVQAFQKFNTNRFVYDPLSPRADTSKGAARENRTQVLPDQMGERCPRVNL